jgi:hypothetical protein
MISTEGFKLFLYLLPFRVASVLKADAALTCRLPLLNKLPESVTVQILDLNLTQAVRQAARQLHYPFSCK